MKTEDLIARAEALHDVINNAGCFSTWDLLEYDRVVAELERRGYSVNESTRLTITK